MTTIPLKFQVGARTIAKVDRMLTRVALSLDDAIEGAAPVLPPLAGDGYLITSLPEPRLEQLTRDGLIGFVRQRYTRYWTDLAAGYDQWFAGLSGNARSMVKRKTKRLVQSSGGALDVREYHGANALAEFYPLARALSAKTYQERLLGSGLPTDAASVQHLYALAAVDRVRAWLLFIEGAPIAYLCCTADGETLIYNHVGHDPSQNELSPGTVLQAEAMKAPVRRSFRALRFYRGRGAAQAAVRDRRGGVCGLVAVAPDARQSRRGDGARRVRRRDGIGQTRRDASRTGPYRAEGAALGPTR